LAIGASVVRPVVRTDHRWHGRAEGTRCL